jgi:hypothetical protein
MRAWILNVIKKDPSSVEEFGLAFALVPVSVPDVGSGSSSFAEVSCKSFIVINSICVSIRIYMSTIYFEAPVDGVVMISLFTSVFC